MKLYDTKTGLKRNHFRLIIGFYLLCCYANAQEANQFLDMLRKTDGIGNSVETVLGPNLPANLFSELLHPQKNTEIVDIRPELLSWASIGTKPRVFKNELINDFFKKLFHLIEKSYPDITLNRVNLFHAHLVKSPDDFILVFHAFEYPIDLEPQKFALAKKLNPKITPFTSKSENFNRRNLIWSLKKNKIWRFDSSSKFNFLVRSPAFEFYPEEVLRANALQENLFGRNIGDLNFFPSEEKKLFINIFSN